MEAAPETVDAKAGLAALEAREPLSLIERLTMPREPYRAEAGAHVAGGDLVAKAAQLGFRFLGRYSFNGMWGRRPLREAWVDGRGVVRLSMRSETGDGITRMMSRYYLSTTLDDGTALVTWSKSPPPVPTSGRAWAFGGTGDLEADYVRHLGEVASRAGNRRPLRFDTIDGAIALATWHDVRLSQAGLLRWSVYVQYAALVPLVVGFGLEMARHPAGTWGVRAGIALILLGVLLYLARGALTARTAPTQR